MYLLFFVLFIQKQVWNKGRTRARAGKINKNPRNAVGKNFPCRINFASYPIVGRGGGREGGQEVCLMWYKEKGHKENVWRDTCLFYCRLLWLHSLPIAWIDLLLSDRKGGCCVSWRRVGGWSQIRRQGKKGGPLPIYYLYGKGARRRNWDGGIFIAQYTFSHGWSAIPIFYTRGPHFQRAVFIFIF